ncbi:MAG TPA: GNAT family N-acetyltransferase [Baekduia sp.]|uniref:GNAT family N-acetyltransferase n=1 Tax=Baekduia sp. TaxID=2600305 RepID=UPI002D78A62E|nr:GNAT family N-acetyltransferase [Baekduia sp.]HET6510450.1 GNAT family N-acetyltransferase [Baekduia sp.]
MPELALRRIEPEDKDGLVAGLGHLSERSVYQRFLSPKPRLTSSELRYLTEVDFRDHYALVAVLAQAPDVIVGVGRWVRDTRAPADAEIAIVIADDLQGRGVGTALGNALAEAARARGIERLTASMLPENVAAHRLFAKISSRMRVTHAQGVDEIVASLPARVRHARGVDEMVAPLIAAA